MVVKIKPMLYVNKIATYDEDLRKIVVITDDKVGEKVVIPSGEYIMSVKLDGVRALITKDGIFSRSGKEFPNPKIREHFAHLIRYCIMMDVALDGEFYDHTIGFGEIITVCMTKNRVVDIPPNFKYHIFDVISLPEIDMVYSERLKKIPRLEKTVVVEQISVTIPEESVKVKKKFLSSLDEGYEGIILRLGSAPYKFGRTTAKCGGGYKFKQYVTNDAQILEVIQGTVVKEEAEKETDEFGYSKTSRKKDDRELVEKASAFLCRYNGNVFKVSLGVTDEEAEEIWKNKEKYIGEFCEFKSMETTKTLPRHPSFLRMRWREQDE